MDNTFTTHYEYEIPFYSPAIISEHEDSIRDYVARISGKVVYLLFGGTANIAQYDAQELTEQLTFSEMQTDACIIWNIQSTSEAHTIIGTAADCPVITLGIPGVCVAMIHAGWRGIANDIIGKTLNIIQDRMDLSRITHAQISPHAQGTFEFELDVFYEQFADFMGKYHINPDTICPSVSDTHGYLDLSACIRFALGHYDCPEAEFAPENTLDTGNSIPSYRKHAEK